jgi:uncharacterized RDD family membrane protein YckC
VSGPEDRRDDDPPRWLPPTDGPPATPPAPEARPEAEPERFGRFSAPVTQAPARSVVGATAHYWSRVGAAVVDFFVRLALVLAGLLVGALFYSGGDSAGQAGVTAGIVVGVIAGLAYAPIMIARTGGQTVGHKATDTRIVRKDGTALDGGGAAMRELVVKWLLFEVIGGFILIPTIVNYLWPLWDAEDETLHDKICSTRVVDV